MNPMLQISGLRHAYGRAAVLNALELSVDPGERVMLTGPSGCGKTTLLRLIAGLECPSAGEICIGGVAASSGVRIRTPPHRRGIAMVFQDLGLWPNLSALDNVLLALSGAGLARGERKERAQGALADCGVADLRRRRPHQLSGGEQQRVAIARAVAARPPLLLLDEPFTGLDVTARHQILALIDRLAREHGATVILSGHHLPDARLLAARIAVLEQGRVVETGTYEALMRAPASETTRAWQREEEA